MRSCSSGSLLTVGEMLPPPLPLPHRVVGLDAFGRSSQRLDADAAAVRLAAPSPTAVTRLPPSMSAHPAVPTLLVMRGAAITGEAFPKCFVWVGRWGRTEKRGRRGGDGDGDDDVLT